MVVRTEIMIALYCPHCGKLHKHMLSRFAFRANCELICSCGWRQAVLTTARNQYLLKVPCAVCQTTHVICLEVKNFWNIIMEKVYCPKENLELGIVGNQQVIDEMVAGYKREFNGLIDEVSAEEYIEDPQVMLEVLNRIHDIAEKGGITCLCGSSLIEAQLLPDGIEIECVKCGGMLVVPAGSERDLHSVGSVDTIELIPPRHSGCKH